VVNKHYLSLTGDTQDSLERKGTHVRQCVVTPFKISQLGRRKL